MLKIWFLSGILLFLYSIVVTFTTIYFKKEKLLSGCVGMVYLLFQLYSLWIVKLFTKELTSIASGSQLELGLGGSTVELDSKSVSVYSISEQPK
jgi:hypothetical protein